MDALLAIPILLLVLIPFWRKKMYRWMGLIGLIAVYEGVLSWTTHRTLSQEFWAVSLTQPGSWTVMMLVLLATAWGLLLVHLAWKRLVAWWNTWRNQ